ncbi:hypothetical protein VITFI_CDS2698 [Vitreoscilla filiformis]|uniref:ProQ/FinO domain-containing protein n=1 Tax=Vitreoscilla filiformis TaxID=63 RepID=A0A221KHP0_VITFI|nr:ProQ/FinO family protein [Vitreoscilla filiformis]ASM78475.1 hypothetical protein VITFI_CDS2698 [Vitreoscilla filiformis]
MSSSPQPIADTPAPTTTETAEVIAPAAEEATAAPQAAPEPVAEAAPVVPGLSPADCARELKQLFPALFDGAPKPLKLRIQADIQTRTQNRFSKKLLSVVLSRHTGATGYLVALTKATHRFDLDGQPVDTVTDEHRQVAQAELDRRRAITAERRAAERAAQKPAGAPGEGAAEAVEARPPRGERPARGNRPAGAERSERGPRGPRRPEGASASGAARGERRGPRDGQQRPARGERPARPAGAPEAASAPLTPEQQAERAARQAARNAEREARKAAAPAAAGTEDTPERRQRATLLRDFERTTLTAANFCALKGLSLASLEEQLAMARKESGDGGGARGAAPARRR